MRWIRVEDRLPYPKEDVIAYKRLSTGYRVGEATFFGIDSSGQIWNWTDDASGVVPTHWMPLPAPPKD